MPEDTNNGATVRVGPGAVLYDTREPERRPCCSEGGRCLFHVTAVYENTERPRERLYEVWCGTHTVRERLLGDDLLAIFDPAGWSWPAGRKPTYHLTREVGVHDNHDLMLGANR